VRGRRGTRISATVLVVLSGAIAILAAAAAGSRAAVVQLTDGSVWVTRTSSGSIARLDHQIEQLDAAVTPPDNRFDVVQSGYSAFSVSSVDGTIQPIDTAAVTLGQAVTVRKGFAAALGGQTLALTSEGEAWILNEGDLASFDLRQPSFDGLGTLPGSYAATVGVDGVAHIYSTRTDQLIRASVATDGGLAASSETLSPALAATAAQVAITAVGAEPVVLDASDDVLWVNGATVTVPGTPGDVELQQPGPSNDVVYVASDRGLFSVTLSGAHLLPVPLPAGEHVKGAPAAPVYDDGCANGAWQLDALYVYRCGETGTAATYPIVGFASDAQANLVFRVNGSVVVLNDEVGGDVWVLQHGLHQVADWPAFEAAVSGKTTPSGNATAPALQAFAQQNKPPHAVPVTFGARPGHTTIFPILAFCKDPNGDVLSIASPAGLPAAEGQLQLAENATEFQYTPPPSTSLPPGSRFTFPYTVTDGFGGNDVSNQAQITVVIEPPTTETPPRQLPGIPTYDVAAGATVSFAALADWWDAEGDPFQLVDVRPPAGAAGAGDGITFTPAGQVAFRASGRPGAQTLQLRVQDSLGAVGRGAVRIVVGRQGHLFRPQTEPLLAQAVAGVPDTLHPLGVDSDPNDDPLQLVSVTESDATRATPGLDVAPDYDTGEIQFVASRAGTYYLGYVATDVPASGAGLSSDPTRIRVDVVAPDSSLPPVAARLTSYLAPGGSTTVPVLDSASDPSGDVLVVLSAVAPFGSAVQATVLQNQEVRLTTSGVLTAPIDVQYLLSDGKAKATGEIDVLPAQGASASALPPVAEPMNAVVRAGDVGEIDPLVNDFDPAGGALKIVPGSVSVSAVLSRFPPGSGLLGAPDGNAFVDGGIVRFQAPEKPGEAVIRYEVADAGGQTAASSIDVTVPPPGPVNEPPAPEPIEAAVLAGSAVTLQVPMAGTDPSGESVVLLGPASGPSLGRISQVTPDTMVYQAFPQAHGTDTFTYALRDRSGLVGDGVVRIGVASPPPLLAPPVAVPQTVRVRPGHTVAVPVLAQDYDPQGYALSLVPSALSAHGATAAVAGDEISVTAPPVAGRRATVDYGITDGFPGAPTIGVLTVIADPDAPLFLPPVAEDIVVASLADPRSTSLTVPVLAHVTQPGGTAADLRLTALPGATAPYPRIAGGSVVVPLTAATRVLVYEVAGAGGATAEATITVPPAGTDTPVPRATRSGFSTPENTPYTVEIGDFVSDPGGRTLRLVSSNGVTGAEGSVQVLSTHAFRYIPDHGYAGPASVTFLLTDSPRSTLNPVELTITLAVTVVGDAPPVFRGPTIEVAIGKTASVTLTGFVVDPNPGARVTYSSPSAPPALHAGIAGDVLTVHPQGDSLVGTSQTVSFTLTDGLTPRVAGQVLVQILATDVPLAVAPPQSATVDQGQSVPIDVLQADVDPFPSSPLQVLLPHVVSGVGTVSSKSDGTIVFTAGPAFSGTATVVYTLEDETREVSREVQGIVTITVYGRPGTPGAPQVVASGNEDVLLAWSAPPDNGQPILRYLLHYDGTTQTIGPVTSFTVTGLQNGKTYRFSVSAENSVPRAGPPSPLSAPVIPDVVPPQLSPPTTTFHSKSITVRWQRPVFPGTPPDEYRLTISGPNGTSSITTQGTSYPWTGLQNGDSYTFTVAAHNERGWGIASAPSAPQTPAAVPGPPGTPSGTPVPDDPTGGKVDVRWTPSAPNGDTPYYTLTVTGGAQPRVVTVRPPAAENPVTVELSGLANNTSYSFSVTATNKAGPSRPSSSTSSFTVFSAPDQVTDLSATNYQNDQTTLSWTTPNDNGQPIGSFQYWFGPSGSSPPPSQSTSWIRVDQASGPYTVTSGLTNGTSYSFYLEACNTYCSSDPSNATPPQPSGGTSGTTFNFSWQTGTADGCSVPSNGYRYSVAVNGSGGGPNGPWTATTGPGSYSYQGTYKETVTLYLSVVDSCGNASTASTDLALNSGPPPCPCVSITGPVDGPVTCSATGGTCWWVGVSGSGFPPGATETYSCSATGAPDYWSGTVKANSSGDVTLPGPLFNGQRNGCQYGQTGGQVTVTVGGTTSAPYTWPSGY
jgi:hypothetical protein